MNSGKLDVLHNGRNKCVSSVAYGICLTLKGVIQESVYKYRSVRCDTNGSSHISVKALVIVYDLHTTSTENV